LNDKEIEIEVAASGGGMPMFEIPGMPGAQMGAINIGDIFGKLGGGRTKTRRVTVLESHEILVAEESDKLLDQEQLVQEAIHAVEQNGIVFLDEIDKITARDGRVGGDVSREGVQRDLLAADRGHHGLDQARRGEDRPHPVHRFGRVPCVEARPTCCLNCRAGCRSGSSSTRSPATTCGASSPTPKAALIKQYVALMATEGVTLEFSEDAIDAIADVAVLVNSSVENIGRPAPADRDGAGARRDFVQRHRPRRRRP
jgi:ATP-dependent HslUV protease ATP-binding subunit HslU